MLNWYVFVLLYWYCSFINYYFASLKSLFANLLWEKNTVPWLINQVNKFSEQCCFRTYIFFGLTSTEKNSLSSVRTGTNRNNKNWNAWFLNFFFGTGRISFSKKRIFSLTKELNQNQIAYYCFLCSCEDSEAARLIQSGKNLSPTEKIGFPPLARSDAAMLKYILLMVI